AFDDSSRKARNATAAVPNIPHRPNYFPEITSMNRAVAALVAAFVVGNLAFVAAVVHAALIGKVGGIDIAAVGGACLVACSTVALIVRRRPRINGGTTPAHIYAERLEQVSAGR
ncbi:hypothetical protein, partial [Nonomuraea sp. NPDC049028]|uniref:hypothetical protein n=1 Tax=Nonomuraea sp. NPDC049028 TaxID=3364348 RepID=UPI003721AB3A